MTPLVEKLYQIDTICQDIGETFGTRIIRNYVDEILDALEWMQQSATQDGWEAVQTEIDPEGVAREHRVPMGEWFASFTQEVDQQ